MMASDASWPSFKLYVKEIADKAGRALHLNNHDPMLAKRFPIVKQQGSKRIESDALQSLDAGQRAAANVVLNHWLNAGTIGICDGPDDIGWQFIMSLAFLFSSHSLRNPFGRCVAKFPQFENPS